MTLRRALIGGGILLVLAMLLTIALLIGMVLGRGEQSQGEGSSGVEATKEQAAQSGESDKQDSETTDATTSPEEDAVGQGETLEYADRTVTLNDVQRGYIFPSGYPRPTPGREFVIANVTITNKSSQPIPANSYNFESEDSKGARVRAQATQVPEDAIFIGRLAPRGELTGNLVFEVEQGDPTIRIVYVP